jgi:hypothetical protein
VVEVEHLERGEQVASAGPHDLGEPRRRNVLGNDHGYVLEHGREARDVAVRRHPPLRELVDEVHLQLERRSRPLKLPLAEHERMQLAHPAELHSFTRRHGCRPAGVEERPRGCARPGGLHAPVRDPGCLHECFE